MKGKQLILASVLALSSLSAFANTITTPTTTSVTTDKVLSIQTLTEGSTSVQLPTIQKADGSVCTSYVADIKVKTNEDKSQVTTTTVRQFCGSEKSQLSALQNVEKDGLTIQVPKIKEVKGS
jgi:hypothetical protein